MRVKATEKLKHDHIDSCKGCVSARKRRTSRAPFEFQLTLIYFPGMPKSNAELITRA
jgi:hypothetical protein